MTVLDHTREGRGRPTVVFVHGFGCARGDWRHQVAHLRGRYETVAVDLGGHGTTPGTPEHTRIDTHGADVARLLAELGLERAVLVGHSMGCRVVAHAMTEAPARVAGLVLVDGSRLGAAGSTAHLQTRQLIAEKGYRGFVAPFFAQMFSPGYDKAEAQAIIDRASNMPADLAGALFPDIGRWDSERFDDAFANVRVPLMAIQTTYTNPQRQRLSLAAGQTTPYLDDVRARVAAARIEVIPGIGHFPQLEVPAAVNALLDSFLGELSA